MEQKNKKIISILVEDEFGALSRIIELFGSRGYNLHSICSGEARKKGLQRTNPCLLWKQIGLLSIKYILQSSIMVSFRINMLHRDL